MTPPGPRPVVVVSGGPATPALPSRALPGRAWPRRRTILLAAVVLLGLALLLADQRVRRQEVRALLDRAEAGRAAVAYADGRINATVSYTSPALLSAEVEPRVRTSLQELVRQSAGDRVGDLTAQRQATTGTAVLPWHHAQRRARAALVAYLDARVAYLDGVSRNFGALFADQPQLVVALSAAQKAYERAAPDDAARVLAVFGNGG